MPCSKIESGAAGIRSGHTILNHGAGGVSIAVLQFVLALGANAFTTSNSGEKDGNLHSRVPAVVLEAQLKFSEFVTEKASSSPKKLTLYEIETGSGETNDAMAWFVDRHFITAVIDSTYPAVGSRRRPGTAGQQLVRRGRH